MSVIQFVRNMNDLSTDKGYQFRFYCDQCGNGYLSSFQNSTLGTAESLLRAAGSVFGGWVNNVSNSAYEIQRAVGGKAHDSALSQAVQEGKLHFHECTRCGHWVCPEVCWNAAANMCAHCAPKLEEEMASAQAQAKVDAARGQLFTKAQSVDYAGGIDMSADSQLRVPGVSPWETPQAASICHKCGVNAGKAKFCPECGTPVVQHSPACNRCGFQPQSPVKFCPECGNHL